MMIPEQHTYNVAILPSHAYWAYEQKTAETKFCKFMSVLIKRSSAIAEIGDLRMQRIQGARHQRILKFFLQCNRHVLPTNLHQFITMSKFKIQFGQRSPSYFHQLQYAGLVTSLFRIQKVPKFQKCTTIGTKCGFSSNNFKPSRVDRKPLIDRYFTHSNLLLSDHCQKILFLHTNYRA